MTNKAFQTKRGAAKALRMAADSIEEHGWIRGAPGNAAKGFCAVGALAFAAKTNTYDEVPNTCPIGLARKILGDERINELLQMEKEGNSPFYRRVKWDAKTDNYKHVGPRQLHFISFNDRAAKSCEEVIKLFRGLARELEHGGSL